MPIVLLFLAGIVACFMLPYVPVLRKGQRDRRAVREAAERALQQQAQLEADHRRAGAQAEAAAEKAAVRADPLVRAVRLVLRAAVNLLGPLIAARQAAEEAAKGAADRACLLAVDQAAAEEAVPAGIRAGVGRSLVVTGAALIPFGAVLLYLLDYPLFAATQGPFVAVVVTPVTILVLAISGVGLGLGFGWHTVFADRSRYFRQVVVGVSALTLACCVMFLVMLAPHRSGARNDARVQSAQNAADLDQRRKDQGDDVSAELLAMDEARLRQAVQARTDAAKVDRLIVLVGALLELPLVEAGVCASSLLPLRAARKRRRAADVKAEQGALDAAASREALHAGVRRVVADLYDDLTSHGVENVQEVIQKAFTSLNLPNVGTQVVVEVERIRAETDPGLPARGGPIPTQRAVGEAEPGEAAAVETGGGIGELVPDAVITGSGRVEDHPVIDLTDAVMGGDVIDIPDAAPGASARREPVIDQVDPAGDGTAIGDPGQGPPFVPVRQIHDLADLADLDDLA